VQSSVVINVYEPCSMPNTVKSGYDNYMTGTLSTPAEIANMIRMKER
jgi:hypothetical protein